MLRKIDTPGMQTVAEVRECPESDHRRAWCDADAVRDHGVLIARRERGGYWYDADGRRVDGRRYAALRSVGVATNSNNARGDSKQAAPSS